MPLRPILALLLLLAAHAPLNAQEAPANIAQATVAGQSILGRHAFFSDLVLELASYPMNPAEIELAVRVFPVVEAWARTHPEQWTPNLIAADEVRSYLEMDLWQEADLDGAAILTLQMKLILFDEIISLDLADREAMQARLESLQKIISNSETPVNQQSAARAKQRHINEIVQAMSEVPKSKWSLLNTHPYKIRDLSQRAAKLRWYKRMLPALPLLFAQGGNGLRFFGPKEWSRALVGSDAGTMFQMLHPTIFVNFESYTMSAGNSLNTEYLTGIASSFIEGTTATELLDIGISESVGGVGHGFVHFAMDHEHSHFVMHFWQVGGNVFQLTFISPNAPWSQAHIILDEIIHNTKVGKTYRNLRVNLPEAGLQVYSDESWTADASPPSGQRCAFILAQQQPDRQHLCGGNGRNGSG